MSKSILLGSIDSPLKVKPFCEPKDISENAESTILACLCESDLCNANSGETLDNWGQEPQSVQQQKREQNYKEKQETTPSYMTEANHPAARPTQPDQPGLQCYSCGSLLDPSAATCDQFDRSDSRQAQTCSEGEACLLYTWSQAQGQAATLRECFPTSVLLGSISAPLLPTTHCEKRDITDGGDGSILACLCHTDYCNDEQRPQADISSKPTTSEWKPQPTTTSPWQLREPATSKKAPKATYAEEQSKIIHVSIYILH